MTDEDFKFIKHAIELVQTKQFEKLEGKGWKVYRVGNQIRVDINE